MPSKTPLPPISDESFDGEHQSTTVVFNKCTHSKVYFQDGVLKCPCGAGWQGPGLNELYKLLHKD